MRAISEGPDRVLVGGVAAVLLALSVGVANAALTPQETAGKQIYMQGTSPRGSEVTAYVGSEGVRLPASAVPCAGCHGYDGIGRPEGGVIPADIRWSHLTKAYGHIHEDGRRHGAFDAAGIARAVTTGLDPAGNRLDRAMPVYEMSDADMADLTAYLERLETDLDPGIGETSLQVATLLPLEGPDGELGQAMAQVLQAFFADLNAAGGIYGRRIELLAIPFGASPESTLETAKLALRREGIFALVGAYTVDLEYELLALLRTEHTPLVGPFTLHPGDETLNEGAFYIYPGFADQARALVDEAFAKPGVPPARVSVVAPDDPRADALVAAVRDQMQRYGQAEPVSLRYTPEALDAASIAARIRESGSDVLLFFGTQAELDPLLPAIAEGAEPPRLFLLSSLVSESLFDAPPVFNERIFLAFPTLASDVSESGRAEYQLLAERHALPIEHLQAQVAAFAAAKLFAEGVKRSGRDISRRAFVDQLESLYAFETGVTPPLSYGPNRRVGARGAHVVAVDLVNQSSQPVGDWHEVR